jgi:hypothetical protein
MRKVGGARRPVGGDSANSESAPLGGRRGRGVELHSRAVHAALGAIQRLVDMYEPPKGIGIALLAGGVLTLVGVALVILVLCVVWALQ